MSVIGGVREIRRRAPAYKVKKGEISWGTLQVGGYAGIVGICEAVGDAGSAEGLAVLGVSGLLMAFARPIIGLLLPNPVQ